MKAIIKSIVFLVLAMLAFAAYGWYAGKGLKEFCSSSNGLSLEEVQNESEERELVIMHQDNEEALLVNHRAPYFRVGCTLKLKDGSVSSSRVYSAD